MSTAAAQSNPDADVQAARLKAYLMQADAEGRSLYEHLEACMLDMLDENTLDVAHRPERFAEFSALIKQQQFAYGDAAAPTSEKAPYDPAVLARAAEALALFKKPEPEVVTTIDQPTPFMTVTTTTVVPKAAPSVRSVAAEGKYWRFAGVGLPEREAFHLDQSITKLAMEKKLDEVRFFGKIFGTRGNYLVVTSKRHTDEGEEIFEEENVMPKPPRKKVEVDVQPEPGYKGCNRLSFWVAPHAAAPWTKLPDVTPQQLNAARRVKKLFTGDLDADVMAYPAFPGQEREYLRAQLGRILAATYIAPANALEAYTPEEEEEEEEEPEEGKPAKKKPAKYVPLTAASKEYAPDEEAGVAALTDLEQWQHGEAYIYETGRATKVPPKPEVEGEEEDEEPAEEEDEEEKKEEEEKELFVPVKKDALYAVINIPKEPNPEEDGEEEEAAEEGEGEEGENKEDEEEKIEEDDDIPDDDPLRRKLYAWTARTVNTVYKKHGVAVVRSLRWPGAIAYAAQQGKRWGAVYLGDGLKKTDHAFTPMPAELIQKEAPDMTEIADATAANEKLVLRGEEPKEADSEDEKEDEEVEEEADE